MSEKYKTEEERKEHKRLYDKEYRKKNKDRITKRIIKWQKENPEKFKNNQKTFYYKNKKVIIENRIERYHLNLENEKNYNKKYREENNETIKITQQKWRDDNKDYFKVYRKDNSKKINKYLKDKRDNDPLFKLKGNIRSLIRQSFNRVNGNKSNKTNEILGCSYKEFKTHIEAQWKPWMNWGNYGNPKDGILEGNKSWDIDHKIQLASAKTKEEIIKLNHYTNLQPLCSYVNRIIKR
jgi:hypothetical protein